MMQKLLISVTACLAVAASGANAQPKDWPTKSITFVVPSAPGGSTDYIARLVAEPLSRALGQPIVIDNRPGGAGNIGAEAALRGGSDVYTFLVQYSGYHVGNPALFPGTMRWNPTKDYTGVAMLMRAPHVIAVGKDIPAQNLKELIEYGRKNSKGLTYASSGPGSIQHIAGEMFHKATGVPMTHVPYKGAGPATTDLMGGQVDVFITTPPAVIGQVQSGKVKMLAYTAPQRHPSMPNVPTSAEAGLAGYEVESWFALFAPAATPKPVIEKLTAEIRKVVESDALREKVNAQGAFATYMDPAQLNAFVHKEMASWADIIRSAKIKAE
jgi:tripartite-type tricarboxylate transporter receptor subunit TctC